MYCCSGERSAYCCGSAVEPKGGDGEEKKGGDAAALPQAVAPVGAPSVHSYGGAEEKKGCDGDATAASAHAAAPVGAPRSAAAGLYGEWRGYSESCCSADKLRFR
jgi:hypothetical protein